MIRSRSQSKRSPASRKPQKIYVIATEGEKTERIYFNHDCFKGKIYRKNILHTENGQSSPKSVLKRLKDHAKKKTLNPKTDELWLIIDVDRWSHNDLLAVRSACNREGYSLGISNPSFELWLLLHQDNPTNPLTTQACVTELRRLLGGPYDKSNYDPSRLLPHVEQAISHAQRLDDDCNSRGDSWPAGTRTQVYQLVDKLIK